ncbi:hypothetical protein QE152_g20742 [Popillia japonica]|uniref:Retrotransposon gag domain-containing protein n=1 Tax=Popillia japonica TaxID=7064 RepID=A0AAW1KNF7_POPJA
MKGLPIKLLKLVPDVSASQSDSTEIEVKSIIKNFKCEKYDSNTAAQTFIEYLEAQCRMWGLENKPDNVNFLNTKRELFLSCLKPDTYKELKITFANSDINFEQQTYKDISKKFLSLFQIKTTRFKALKNFWNCTCEKHQTFENYANKLKEIAQYCGYEGEMLDRQLVIDNNEREVPFVQVFAVAQAREAAEKDYYDENDTNVHKIKTKNTYEKLKQRIRTKINKKQWSPAKVIDSTNKYSYKVVTNNGVERRRHADHIRERNDDLPLIDEPVVIDTSELLSTEVPNENQEKSEITTPQSLEPEINDFSVVSVPGTTTPQTETTQLRRSTRIRTIPRRYPE